MNFNFIFILLIFLGCAHQKQHQPVSYLVKTKTPPKPNSKCIKKVSYYRALLKISDKEIGNPILKRFNSRTLCREHPEKIKSTVLNHNRSIGVLFTTQDKERNKAIIEGLKQAQKNYGSKMFFQETPNNKKEIAQVLANMIYEKKIGLLISWGPKQFISHIQKWQTGLELPALYIDKALQMGQQSFQVYPNRVLFNRKMLQQLKRKNIKTIAILTPEKYKNSDFLKELKQTFLKSDINISYEQYYNNDSYSSMDYACREIFVIDRHQRRQEYKRIYRKEKEKAALQGYRLNPKSVFLPAQVNFDAIFIPDNFKTVNHFAKLFQYYQVKNIPMFGTHEWRSPELLADKNTLLNGSFFVDFISSFSQHKDEALSPSIDFKIMGRYAGMIAAKAVTKNTKYRHHVTQKLNKMKMPTKTPVFTENTFNWPSYAFEIERNQIVPIR